MRIVPENFTQTFILGGLMKHIVRIKFHPINHTLFTITKNTKYNTTKSFYFFPFLLEGNFSVGGGFEKWCLVDQILAVHFSSINLERERNSLQMIGNFLGDVQMSLVQVPFVSSTEIFELSAKTLNEHRSIGSTASANKTFDSRPQGDDVTELRFNLVS